MPAAGSHLCDLWALCGEEDVSLLEFQLVSILPLNCYYPMAGNNQTQNWRSHLGWLLGQLLVIFLGVTAAFIVENYRESASQREELRQAVAGLIADLEHYEVRCAQFADGFDSAIEKWKATDGQG